MIAGSSAPFRSDNAHPFSCRREEGNGAHVLCRLGRNQLDHFFRDPIDSTGGPIGTVKMSSGSSGRPKLVPARRSHVEHTLRQLEAMFRMDQIDVALVCLPLAVFLQRIVAYMALRAGAQLHLASAPIAPAALEALEQQGVPIYQGYGMSDSCFGAPGQAWSRRT